ncbi:MAG TPA: hypothetical protein VH796_09965 [Nitrososphaeraceae archaeon]|jgi:hypothetical protein
MCRYNNRFNSIFTILIIAAFFIFIFSPLGSGHVDAASVTRDISSLPISFKDLINKSRNLTQSYQNETSKFADGKYNNQTMVSITNDYLPKFQKVVDDSKILQMTGQYYNASTLYTKSLESELQSYIHFRNYLSTANSTESEASMQSLADAFNYENESFDAIRSIR